MKIIQVVTNSDRCHVSVDGVPQQTYLYSDFLSRENAIRRAKARAFDELASIRERGGQADINTFIEPK